MFEKEAKDYVYDRALKDFYPDKDKINWVDYIDLLITFQDAAKFGYNKANEWHYVKDGDLPTEDLRPRTRGYYLTASKHKSYKGFVFEVAYFTGVIFTKDGDILDNCFAWKEITLPELPEENEQ